MTVEDMYGAKRANTGKNMNKRLLWHIITLVTVKLPLQVIGIVILPIVTRYYQIGQFPWYVRWFDDTKAVIMARNPSIVCGNEFGTEHCEMFHKYNSTWFGRYIWTAWRNACNYFQHFVLGKSHFDPDIWLISRDGFLRVRIGYKIGDTVEYRTRRQEIGIPAQWVFSIGFRL